MKVLHQLYLIFISYTIIASGANGRYTLKFKHNIDNIDTTFSIKNHPKDNEKTVFVEFKRNKSIFPVWEHEQDPSKNAILITIPGDVQRVGFLGGSQTNQETIAFSIGSPGTNSRQFVLRRDSFWNKQVHETFWGFKMLREESQKKKWLPTCTLQIDFQSTLNLQEKKNFNVELVTALIGNVTTAPTPSPTAAPTKSPSAAPTESPSASPTTSPSAMPSAMPTAAPSASPVFNENSDEFTIPMQYKISVCIFIGVFLFLSLMICLNKRVRKRFCSACCICQKKSQELTHETVTITMHEMKTREN